MPKAIDVTGERFGRLVAKSVDRRNGRRMWLCECDCGKETRVPLQALRAGNTKSCGCRKRSVLGESTTKHGMAGTKIYQIWKGMIGRATRPDHPRAHNYFNRGITVCEEWKHFENFFTDMGDAPKGMSLERVDNNKGYEKANCVWATPKQQARNTRWNRNLEHNGVTRCLTDWAEALGMWPSTLHKKLKKSSLSDIIKCL